MTREPPGTDSPGPERRPPDGGQWRSPAPTPHHPGHLFCLAVPSLHRSLGLDTQQKERSAARETEVRSEVGLPPRAQNRGTNFVGLFILLSRLYAQ